MTGHSLGGASLLYAPPIFPQTRNSKILPCILIASPRVGNQAFASLFNRKTGPHYRIYNTNDIVPLLPPFIYTSPRTDKIYHYIHVKKGVELTFQGGSVSANHTISNYFAELAKLDPRFTQQLYAQTPGFCPN